jgi:hypothetical protein
VLAAVSRRYGPPDVVTVADVPTPEPRDDEIIIKELAEASALVPVVGAYDPLARIADAYRHVDAGHKKGTIVVAMS